MEISKEEFEERLKQENHIGKLEVALMLQEIINNIKEDAKTLNLKEEKDEENNKED